MTTSTGKSGQYRYYACHRRANVGLSECSERRIRMETLDDLVIEAVSEQVLQRDRLHDVLQAWIDRSDKAQGDRRERLKVLRTQRTMLDGESASVVKLVRTGVCNADDPQIAMELGNIAAQKKAVAADIETLDRQFADGSRQVTPLILDKFGEAIASKLRDTNDARLRRAYTWLLVDQVEAGRETIRIIGSKSALSQAATGTSPHMVPKVERRWRTRQDSNL